MGFKMFTFPLALIVLTSHAALGQLIIDGTEPPIDCTEELWNNHPSGWLWFRPHETNCSRYWTCEPPVHGQQRFSLHECAHCGADAHDKCLGRQALTFDIDFGTVCVWPDEAHVQCDGDDETTEEAEDTTASEGFTTSTTASSTESRIACEKFSLDLSCGSGQRLNILWANYGRTSEDVCNDTVHDVSKTDCMAANSLDIVQEQCEGSESCTIKARNEVFGDPCYLTYKYLEVEYLCEDANEQILA